MLRYIFQDSKYPENVLFSFENRSTGENINNSRDLFLKQKTLISDHLQCVLLNLYKLNKDVIPYLYIDTYKAWGHACEITEQQDDI